MIVVRRKTLEACAVIAATDRENGHEVRTLLAMALAIGNGDVREAAAALHGASVVAGFTAGEPLEDVLEDTRGLYGAIAKLHEDEEKGVVLS